MQHPDWSMTAAIYQLNQRQLTAQGTFRAAEGHLERIRDLGVEIIWLMPVHPIGEVNRKGRLGSPYAVRDYLSVNPEFGTLDDLRHFVAAAHDLGLKVILDWVANHTAWDSTLVESHPEWYARDYQGDFRPTPWWDWDDIIDLDYDHPVHGPALRDYMIEALEFWVRECDIDGYRCDVAGFVPIDFWESARVRLDAIKPVFMLAEWETRDLHRSAFDASYAWSWNEAMHLIASGGTADIEPLRVFYAWNERSWPHDSMRMTFVSNHDHNHAAGTEYERFGEALPAVTVLSVVGAGIPLVYTGQELGNRRRLEFFDKDLVEGDNDQQAGLYRALFQLKKDQSALWNGSWGARMVRVPNSQEQHVLSFVRASADATSRVFAVFNFSDLRCSVDFGAGPHLGDWADAFSGRALSVVGDTQMDLPAWGWRVFTG
jgi:glycosidase